MKKVLAGIVLLAIFPTDTLQAKQAKKRNLGIYMATEAAEGLFLYSWMVPLALKVQNDNDAFAEILFITPITWMGLAYLNSTFAPEITNSMVLSSLYGATSGAIQGALSGNRDTRWRLGFLLSALENFGNFHLSGALGLNTPTVERWRNFAELGVFHVYLFDNLKGEYAPLYGIVSVLESYGSIPLFMKDTHATWGDAFFENVSTFTIFKSVWLISTGISDTIFDVHDTYRITSGLISTSLGFGIGYYLSRKYDLSIGAAMLILGISSTLETMAISSDFIMRVWDIWSRSYNSDKISYPLIAGGVLLPVLTYGSYFVFAHKEERQDFQHNTGRLNIYINPVATMALLKTKHKSHSFIPLMTLNLTF